jgi:hypothetical protein
VVTGVLTGVEVVIAVVLALAVWGTATVGLAISGALRRWREPILLRPGDRVPLLWRWSPEPAAALHRRLVAAVRWMRLARPPGWPPPPPEPGRGPLHAWRARRRLRAAWDPASWPAWVAPVIQLEDLAATIDHRILQARGQPREVRLAMVRDVASEVAAVERLAGRVVSTLRSWELSVEQPGVRPGPGGAPLMMGGVSPFGPPGTPLGPGPSAAWPRPGPSFSVPAVASASASIAEELDVLDAALEELRRRG